MAPPFKLMFINFRKLPEKLIRDFRNSFEQIPFLAAPQAEPLGWEWPHIDPLAFIVSSKAMICHVIYTLNLTVSWKNAFRLEPYKARFKEFSIMSETSLGYLWGISGRSLGHLWEISGGSGGGQLRVGSGTARRDQLWQNLGSGSNPPEPHQAKPVWGIIWTSSPIWLRQVQINSESVEHYLSNRFGSHRTFKHRFSPETEPLQTDSICCPPSWPW